MPWKKHTSRRLILKQLTTGELVKNGYIGRYFRPISGQIFNVQNSRAAWAGVQQQLLLCLPGVPSPKECTVTCHALIVRRNEHQGEPVRPDTVFYYRSLGVDELQNAIGKMLERIESGLGRVDADLRDQLLPALLIMRERVKPGDWQSFLRAHSLNPATVRKWRARQKATTTSLLHLFGEPREVRQLQRRPEPPENGM
jgi:hypothetical protein